jgi:2-polyprenyl-3-methyl-5-hydroxy-6-metoxy-1,4-benzoquinol methylase
MMNDKNTGSAERATHRVHRLQPKTDAGDNFRFRFEKARPWIEGRSVLDIGAARGFMNLHRCIDEVASRSVAVDLDDEVVAKMREAGVEAVAADAQAMKLDERFDVIFCGELIEHLDNYRGFFDSVRRHLNPGGHLVLTTPNVFRYTGFVYRLGRAEAPVNEDHMVWFCETTLRQLLSRMHFEVRELSYVTHRSQGRLRSLAARTMRAILPPRLAESTIFVVAQPLPTSYDTGPFRALQNQIPTTPMNLGHFST